MKKKIAIVGCGPVGMLASLLFQQMKLDFITLQKHVDVRAHPSAHWITPTSKNILSQIPGLTQKLDSIQQDWKHFQYYRYVQKIGGFQLATKNQFQPSIQAKLTNCKSRFGAYPSNLPQNRLLMNMSQHLVPDRVMYNSQVQEIKQTPKGTNLIKANGKTIVQADYVIIANGSKSLLKNSLSFKKIRHQGLMNITNIFFKSRQLAKLIKDTQQYAMLHFIYNNNLPSVLVNHDLQQGIFVLQAPNFQPFIDLLQIYSPEQLIKTTIQSQYLSRITDLNVIHVGKWKAQQSLCSMKHNNILLAGDAAHSVPPSGAFGMNCGFQDVNQLAHCFSLLQKLSKKQEKQYILLNYARQRQYINLQYLNKSVQNYRLVENIAKSLGLTQKVMQIMQPLSENPLGKLLEILPQQLNSIKQKTRKAVLNYSYKRKKIQSPLLPLFFDQFQEKIYPLSKISRQIFQSISTQQIYDLWVRNDVKLDQYKQYVPQFYYNNPSIKIKFHDQPNSQKIIRSDGRVIVY